jgi:hypothetical protein
MNGRINLNGEMTLKMKCNLFAHIQDGYSGELFTSAKWTHNRAFAWNKLDRSLVKDCIQRKNVYIRNQSNTDIWPLALQFDTENNTFSINYEFYTETPHTDINVDILFTDSKECPDGFVKFNCVY